MGLLRTSEKLHLVLLNLIPLCKCKRPFKYFRLKFYQNNEEKITSRDAKAQHRQKDFEMANRVDLASSIKSCIIKNLNLIGEF